MINNKVENKIITVVLGVIAIFLIAQSVRAIIHFW